MSDECTVEKCNLSLGYYNERLVEMLLYSLSEAVLIVLGESKQTTPGYATVFKNDVFEIHPCCHDCTCGADDAAKGDEIYDVKHELDCWEIVPNFRSGDVGIMWYKYIGRSMKANKELETLEWIALFTKCLESLKQPKTEQ